MKKWKTTLAGLLVVSPVAANAGLIDFSGGDCHELTVCVMTVTGDDLDGATATFSNPVVETGSTNRFFNLSNGLALGSGGLAYTWDVVFDTTVAWVGGFVGFTSSDLGFGVTGPGVSADGILAGASPGAFDLAQPLMFVGGESYSFTSDNRCSSTGCGGRTLRSMDLQAVSVSVPEPGTLALLGLGIAGIGLSRRRNRR